MCCPQYSTYSVIFPFNKIFLYPLIRKILPFVFVYSEFIPFILLEKQQLISKWNPWGHYSTHAAKHQHTITTVPKPTLSLVPTPVPFCSIYTVQARKKLKCWCTKMQYFKKKLDIQKQKKLTGNLIKFSKSLMM